MATFLNKFLVKDVEQVKDLPLTVYLSIKRRVTKIAVNKEVQIPMSKVVANPWIGPVPKTNNMSPVSPVVMFASKIEDKALLNPSLMESRWDFPLANSSRIR